MKLHTMCHIGRNSLILYAVLSSSLLLLAYFSTSRNDVIVDEKKTSGNNHARMKASQKGALTSSSRAHATNEDLSVQQDPVTSFNSCTKVDIKKRPKTIVLTTTNAGFLDIAENMLESIKRTGACPNITVIAEDELTFKVLSKRVKSQPGLHVQKTDSGDTTSEKLMVNTKMYNQLVNKRADYILAFLEDGYRVLFVDVDTFWFRDPFEVFEDDFDIALHNELNFPKIGYCAGFVFYHPTEVTLQLVRSWVFSMTMNNDVTPDQKVLNVLISHNNIPGLRVRTLNPFKYPDGKRFIGDAWRTKHSESINVLHLSRILGHDNKVNTLKRFGAWLI